MTDRGRKFGLNVDNVIDQLLDYKNTPGKQVCISCRDRCQQQRSGRIADDLVVLVRINAWFIALLVTEFCISIINVFLFQT